jgi:hypothetical protein
MPQCQFHVFCYFYVSEKLHRKYSENWTKQKPNIQKFTEAFRDLKRRRSGATRGPHNKAAWPKARPCPLYVRPPRSTSDNAPSPIKTRSEFQKDIAIHRHRRPEIERVQKLFPAPCQRGESQQEVFFIAMVASRVMSEWSTLDYGSIAVARWLFSPPCASCLDLMSCLTWLRSPLCNSTCCVC